MKKIIIGLLMLVLLSASVACGKATAPNHPSTMPAQQESPNTFTSSLELYTQKMTLEEAAKIMGITVPMPDYLPEGFEIQEVYVQNRSARLLISDGPIEKNLVTHTDAAGTRQRYEVQSKIEMSVSWSPEFMIPVRLPEEKVDIKGSPGYLLEVENHKRLVWNWFPDPDSLGVFELGIEVGKGISKEELVKIAESVEFNVAPELYTPQSDQVISERLYDIRKGEFRYLCIYEDGSLTRIEMEGLREPVSQHVRIRKTGKLDEEELSNLVEFFEVSGFKDMDKNNEFSGSPEKGGGVTASDVHYSVSARLGSSYRSIKASNYISPDGGETYPNMPYPLDEIYKRLRDIADNKTSEVVRESL